MSSLQAVQRKVQQGLSKTGAITEYIHYETRSGNRIRVFFHVDIKMSVSGGKYGSYRIHYCQCTFFT